MDIFGDDIDSLLQTDDEGLNENIRDDPHSGGNAEEEDEDKEEKDEHGEPIKVEPKKRIVRNPQVRRRNLIFRTK